MYFKARYQKLPVLLCTALKNIQRLYELINLYYVAPWYWYLLHLFTAICFFHFDHHLQSPAQIWIVFVI